MTTQKFTVQEWLYLLAYACGEREREANKPRNAMYGNDEDNSAWLQGWDDTDKRLKGQSDASLQS